MNRHRERFGREMVMSEDMAHHDIESQCYQSSSYPCEAVLGRVPATTTATCSEPRASSPDHAKKNSMGNQSCYRLHPSELNNNNNNNNCSSSSPTKPRSLTSETEEVNLAGPSFDDEDVQNQQRDSDEIQNERDGQRQSASCWGSWMMGSLVASKEREPLLSVVIECESSCSPCEEEKKQEPTGSSVEEEEEEEEESSEQENALFEQVLKEGTLLESQGRLDEAWETYLQSFDFERLSELHQASLRYRLGLLLWKKGAYKQSLRLINESIYIYCHYNGSVPETVSAEVYLAKGKVYSSLGNHRRAEKSLKRALVFLGRTGEEDDFVGGNKQSRLLFARILHSYANICESNGYLVKALQRCQVALTIQRQELGSSHVDVALSLLSFGSTYEKMGMYSTAFKCYTEALDIYREQDPAVGSTVSDMGAALTNIGWIYHLTGNSYGALTAYNEALGLFKQSLDGSHRNIVSVQIQIGMAYMQQGSHDHALKVYKEALGIQRFALGDDHEDVATTLSAIGVAFERINQCDKAIKCVRHAVKIRLRVFGAMHLYVSETWMQLGRLHYSVGQTDAAIHCYRNALDVYKVNRLEKSDPRVVEVEYQLKNLKPME